MRIGRNVRKQETAVACTQLVDLRRTEDMSFSDGEKAIPLRIHARVRQAGISTEGLRNRTFVPEPAPRDFIFTMTHVAVIADEILVVPNWRNA